MATSRSRRLCRADVVDAALMSLSLPASSCHCARPARPKHERLHKYLCDVHIFARVCVCCIRRYEHCLCMLLRTTNYFICPPLGIDCIFLLEHQRTPNDKICVSNFIDYIHGLSKFIFKRTI